MKDLGHFRKKLEALAEELRASLAAKDPSEDSITPDKAIGRITRMEAIQAQSMNSAAKRRQKKRLSHVEAALEATEEGSYGRCVRCGEDIPEGRLEIMPETRLCVRCAARG